MIGLIVLGVGGASLIASVIAVMVRVDRASQRKLDRMRAEWEAGGRVDPWPGRGSWYSGGGN
jgi:hypothetical protein